MKSKNKLKLLTTVLLAFLTLISFTHSISAAEYKPLNENLESVIINLQTAILPVTFTDTQALSDTITLMNTSLLEINREMSTRHVLFCDDTVAYSPSFEIILSCERYDVFNHVPGQASEYFSVVSGIDVETIKNSLLSMVELLKEAAQYEIVGYDDTLFLTYDLNGITLTMSYMKDEGALEYYTCFMNPIPGFDSAFNYITMDEMTFLINMEKQRSVNSWFAFSNTTTQLFEIEEDMWEIYWNIKSSFVTGSSYSITVLDENDNLVSEIPVGPERMISSEYLQGPGRFKLLINTNKGNWNIQVKEVPSEYAEFMGIKPFDTVQISVFEDIAKLTVSMALVDINGNIIASSIKNSLETELLTKFGSFSRQTVDIIELNSSGNTIEIPYVNYTILAPSETVSEIIEFFHSYKNSYNISNVTIFSCYGDTIKI